MGDDADKLKREMEQLDGPSNMLVPTEAYDIGDVDASENPRACDLDYVEGVECAVAVNIGGTDRIMYDEDNGDARIDCDADTFIEDVGDWN